MSFSSDVKKELEKIIPEDSHCLRAELSAFLSPELALEDPGITAKRCCKKAFLRGMFLSSGTVTDPEKNYQLEIVTAREETAALTASLMNFFSLQAKTVVRKDHYVVYLKEGDCIAGFLALTGAAGSVLALENIRVLKDVRNSVNRKLNCEMANLTKTVSASVRQVRDIEYIREHIGFEKLPEHLRQIAVVRLEYPDLPLSELGEKLNPPIGKSGVNHRLRKLSMIAEEEKL